MVIREIPREARCPACGSENVKSNVSGTLCGLLPAKCDACAAFSFPRLPKRMLASAAACAEPADGVKKDFCQRLYHM